MSKLSLERMKKVTGVFISRTDFNVIEIDYLNFLKENNLNDSEECAEYFYLLWKEESEVFNRFVHLKETDIRFYCMDGRYEDGETTIQEYINQVDEDAYRWEKMCRDYWKNLNRMLEEETLSYEQIFELDKSIKNKCIELINKSIEEEKSELPEGMNP